MNIEIVVRTIIFLSSIQFHMSPFSRIKSITKSWRLVKSPSESTLQITHQASPQNIEIQDAITMVWLEYIKENHIIDLREFSSESYNEIVNQIIEMVKRDCLDFNRQFLSVELEDKYIVIHIN